MSWRKKLERAREIQQELEEEEADVPVNQDPEPWDEAKYREDPVGFAQKILRFNPTKYQVKLLVDEHKRPAGH